MGHNRGDSRPQTERHRNSQVTVAGSAEPTPVTRTTKPLCKEQQKPRLGLTLSGPPYLRRPCTIWCTRWYVMPNSCASSACETPAAQ